MNNNLMDNGRLTFKEWVAKQEDMSVEWAHRLINDLVNMPTHSGDCTKDIHTCSLCLLESLLGDYYNYLDESGLFKDRKI